MLKTPPRIFCYLCATKLEQRSENSWYCPSCEYVQYESPKPAAELILRRGGKILISERGREPDMGTFDMPGGFVEPGETCEQAALREGYEELGIRSDDITGLQYFTSFASYYPYGKEVYHVLVSVFIADLKPGITPAPQDDVASLRWVGLNDVEAVNWTRHHQRNNATRALEEMSATSTRA